jgi:hypothetical protein
VVLDEDERGHTVQIIDDGRGFDAARSSESAPGHLGLTAMRERAEMAGGWLGLESVPGEGATVTVWVPRWDPHVSGHEAPDRDYPRRETANGDGEEEGNQPEQPVPMPAQSRRAGEG